VQHPVHRLLALALVGLALAGCAADPRYQHGLEWVEWNEAQKRQLEAQGFPQYTGPF
jgi:hypothetical protein